MRRPTISSQPSRIAAADITGRWHQNRGRLFCLGLICAAFVLSRWTFAERGHSFDISQWMWQIVDFDLLKSHLTQSVFYLHSQPPLLNLALGAILKLTPDQAHAQELSRNLFRLIGLLTTLLIFQLLVDLEVPLVASLALTLLFEFSPGTLMLENWFYSTYPTQFLLCAAAFCLNRFLKRGRTVYGIGFLVCAALPVFLNSSFQPIWFVCVVGFSYFFFRNAARELIPVALAIVGLMVLLIVKNALIFGTVTTSSWFGMNLARMTTFNLPESERREAMLAGDLSPFAVIPSFSSVENYSTMISSRPTGIPVLDRTHKSEGTVNFNNLLYVSISRHYLADALWTMRHHPGAYGRAVVVALGCYFGPLKDQDLFLRRSARIGVWNRAYDLLLEPVEAPWWSRHRDCTSVSLTLLIGLPLILLLASIHLAYAHSWTSSETTTAFIVMTIVYASLVGVMLEIGENARFRSTVDPLFLVLLGVLIANFTRKTRSPSRTSA